MALDESDRLSVVALVVALIALGVSYMQLIQQFFATAIDGKRFCQGSVVGIWSRKTRLSWRWSQWRFETKYTVPEIRLTSGIIEEQNLEDPDTDQRSRGGSQRWVYKLHPFKWLTEAGNGYATDWNRWFEISSNEGSVPLEMRLTRSQTSQADLTPRSSSEYWSLWFMKHFGWRYIEDSPDTVSWPTFLRSVYSNQIHAVRKIESKFAAPFDGNHDAVKAEKGEVAPDAEAPCAPLTKLEKERGEEERVVIRLVELSWDLIPSDVYRPMAKSTVGTIIVIAHRLGMNWIGDFNPNDGKMNAAGCGHTFTSEAYRAVGVVLKYTHHPESKLSRSVRIRARRIHPVDYFAPTDIADKLHCGILPIDAAALPPYESQEDIHLIDHSQKMDLPGLISRIGVSTAEAGMLRGTANRSEEYGTPRGAFRHGIEEAVSILCPIAALEDADARWIMWPFRSKRQPFTPLRKNLALKVLKTYLAKFLTDPTRDHWGAQIIRNRQGTILDALIESPLESLEYISESWEYLHNHRSEIEGGSPKPDTQAEVRRIYEKARCIHDSTSVVFASIAPPMNIPADDTKRPFLFDLVAAQVTKATRHGKAAYEFAQQDDTPNDADEPRASGFNTGVRFAKKLADLYVTDMNGNFGDERTIVSHLYRRGYTHLSRAEIKALWWTMVVRSACWWISVRVKLPETQIPSYWYNSQTPVYVT